MLSLHLRVLAILAVAVVTSAFVAVDTSLSVNFVIPGATGIDIAFNTNGDLYYLDGGCLKVFKKAADTPFLGTINFNSAPCKSAQNVGFTGIVISEGGRLYTTVGTEIDTTTGATIRQAWTNCGAVHGIALGPDGSVYFSNYGSRKLYKVPNPDLTSATYNTPCNTPFADVNALGSTGCDGITVGPDGTVYCAGYDKGTVLLISQAGTLIGVSTSGKPQGQGPDGISICVGDGVNFAITSLAASQAIGRVNLTGPGGSTATPPYAFSLVATNTGGYNDWTAVDPYGCIWGSTTDGTGGIYRISNADGSCPKCSSPQVTASNNTCACATSQTVTYLGSSDQSQSFSSTSDCAALNFA